MSGRRSPEGTHYDVLGVERDCGPDELRAAYRRLAWTAHPDVGNADTVHNSSMAEINEAWRILSNPDSRRSYDAGLKSATVATPPRSGSASSPMPFWQAPIHPQSGGTSRAARRRQAWVAGVQAQMARLARQAGRSATQTLLIRNARGDRGEYDALVDELVTRLAADVESRARAARAAGAAPLDLGVAATLVGVRSVADEVRRQGSLSVSKELLMEAELLDRMWDVLAHELPSPLTVALGGNPRTARALNPRRS